MRRIWNSLYSVFDGSPIRCTSGEKSSTASAAARNNNRTLAGIDAITRQHCGRKIDLLFEEGRYEFGCAECGKHDLSNSTKELIDGSFKMPKVLKDMFVNLLSASPSLTRKLSVFGFILMETKVVAVTLDSLNGYICRLTKYEPLYFPEHVEEFGRKLPTILEAFYRVRLAIENTRESLIKDDTVNSQVWTS